MTSGGSEDIRDSGERDIHLTVKAFGIVKNAKRLEAIDRIALPLILLLGLLVSLLLYGGDRSRPSFSTSGVCDRTR